MKPYTRMVGPVYVGHPYSAPTAEERAANVESAAAISTALNRMGVATISPLQESRCREGALDELGWRGNAVVQLRACKAIAVPLVHSTSSPSFMLDEMTLAKQADIPIFYVAVLTEGWLQPYPVLEDWVRRESEKP